MVVYINTEWILNKNHDNINKVNNNADGNKDNINDKIDTADNNSNAVGNDSNVTDINGNADDNDCNNNCNAADISNVDNNYIDAMYADNAD